MINKIGFLAIMSGTGVLGYLIVREMHPEISPLMPVISYVFVSYIVAKLYMNVFGLAVDTSLQCFLACEEMRAHSREFDPTPFVPQELQDFITEKVDSRNKLKDGEEKDGEEKGGDEKGGDEKS